jgi:hypothetical protein
MMAGKAHYSGLVLPFVAVTAAAGLSRLAFLGRRELIDAASMVLVITCLVGYAREGAGPFGGNYAPATVTPHARLAMTLAQELPPDASVSATSALVPRVSRRPRVYVFPAIEDAEFVFLDLQASPAPTSAGDVFLRARGLLGNGGWEVQHAADGLLLLRRVDAAGPTDVVDIGPQLFASAATVQAIESPISAGATSYLDGRVRLLDANLVPSPDGAIDVDGPRAILRTVWLAAEPLSSRTRLEFWIDLRDGSRRRVWDVAQLWWNPPARWPVDQPVTVDIPDISARQFVSWQAVYSESDN